MKIGFIKKRFTPYGGAEKYLASIIGRLNGEGHEIHLFASSWEPAEGVSVHTVKDVRFLSLLSVLSFNRNASKKVKETSLDCVVGFERTTCCDIYRAGDGCHREWLKIRRRVEGPKGLSFGVNPLHLTLLRLEEEIFRKTKMVVANSGMVKRQIIDNYEVPESSVKVIYNGVDARRFSPESRIKWRSKVRKELSMPAGVPVILFVGSGFRRKGLDVLIKAMHGVKHEARLIVIGRGDAGEYEKSDRVLFLGPRRDIERFYAMADLFVLPTLYDPFSNATLEAMSSGLPVVTTANNGAAELVAQGEEGYILDDMLSDSELAERVNSTVENLDAMGKKARRKAEGFPVDGAASEIIRLIKECAR
jgi:UDP-glucose:(heptosyl)LPS alpha-1,3-glucosyltransferase